MNDKKWVYIGLGIGAAAVALFSSFSSKTTTSKSKNMNQGKTDSKQNRGGATYALFNLNPLNVKKGKVLYPGEITADGAMHRMFDSWTSGTAAGMLHIWRYMNGKVTGDAYPSGTKLNTIEKICSTWTPRTDPKNDTENYIQFVVKNTGFGRTQLLRWEKETILVLVAVMAVREDRDAAKFLDNDVLLGAWEKAAKLVLDSRFY